MELFAQVIINKESRHLFKVATFTYNNFLIHYYGFAS